MTAHTFGPQRAIIDTLKARWRLYAVEGVVMIVLGVLAVVFPVFAMLAVDLYLGWVFLLAGLLALAAVFSARHIPGFWWVARHRDPGHRARLGAALEARRLASFR